MAPRLSMQAAGLLYFPAVAFDVVPLNVMFNLTVFTNLKLNASTLGYLAGV